MDCNCRLRFKQMRMDSCLLYTSPYIGTENVVVIGETTVGKNVAMEPYQDERYNFILWPVVALSLIHISTRSFWNATFAVQSNGNFLETIRVNLWEGQLASLAWAWDHGRVFQTAALFLLGMLIGRKELFLKEHLKVWNKVLAGSLVAFFPLYGLGNMLPDFITNKSILTPLSLIIRCV